MALSGTTKTFIFFVTILFLFFIITNMVMYFELEPLFEKVEDDDDCINTIEKTCKLSKCALLDTKKALIAAWVIGMIAFVIYAVLIWWYTSGGALFGDTKPTTAPAVAPAFPPGGFGAVLAGNRPN